MESFNLPYIYISFHSNIFHYMTKKYIFKRYAEVPMPIHQSIYKV